MRINGSTLRNFVSFCVNIIYLNVYCFLYIALSAPQR